MEYKCPKTYRKDYKKKAIEMVQTAVCAIGFSLFFVLMFWLS